MHRSSFYKSKPSSAQLTQTSIIQIQSSVSSLAIAFMHHLHRRFVLAHEEVTIAIEQKLGSVCKKLLDARDFHDLCADEVRQLIVWNSIKMSQKQNSKNESQTSPIASVCLKITCEAIMITTVQKLPAHYIRAYVRR